MRATEDTSLTDREKAGLRGAVRKVISDAFVADYQTRALPDSGRREETTYLGDGRLETQTYHNPDGSTYTTNYVYAAGDRLVETHATAADTDHVTRYTYDEQGRLSRVSSGPANGPDKTQETYSYGPDGAKTKIYFVPVIPKPAPGEGAVGINLTMEGSNLTFFGAADAATMTMIYNVSGSPRETLIHNDHHKLIARMRYTCDSAGRILEEALEPGDVPLPIPDKIPEEARAAVEKVFMSEFMHVRATHKYDEDGNEIELTQSIGSLNQETRRTQYNEQGDKVLEESESIHHERRIDPEGGEPLDTVKTLEQRTKSRYEHQYDGHGNWTKRIQWTAEPDHTEFRSMLEKRTITYY